MAGNRIANDVVTVGELKQALSQVSDDAIVLVGNDEASYLSTPAHVSLLDNEEGITVVFISEGAYGDEGGKVAGWSDEDYLDIHLT